MRPYKDLKNILAAREKAISVCLTCSGGQCFVDNRKADSARLLNACGTLFAKPKKFSRTEFIGPSNIYKAEIKYSIDGIIKKLNSMKKHDIQHSLIVVAEAVKKEDGSTVLHKYMDGEQRLGGIGDYIAQEIMKKTEVECRVTSLGHVQRGAPPTASDRILASAFGVYAVDLLNQKKFDRMVAWRDRKVVDVPIDEGISTYKNVERKDSLVETALSLDIYIGDET